MQTSPAQERVSGLLFYATVLSLGYLLYLIFNPFLVPLAWAAILAALFERPNRQLIARWGPAWGASASTAGVTLVILVPVAFVATSFVAEASLALRSLDLSTQSEGFSRVQGLWSRVQESRFGANVGSLENLVREITTWLAGAVASQTGAVLRNAALLVVNLMVMLFAVFFFFRDGKPIMAAVRRVLPFEPEQSERMIAEARDLIHASVTAALAVAAIQGALGGITFAVLGIGAPVFWGVVMAFFSLLPIAGSWVVWGPAAAWLLLTGSVGRGIALIAVGAGIVGLVDNFLRPAMLSGRTQLNGLLVFVSLIGGITAFGLLGVVLGPIVVASAVGVLDGYTRK